jgi:hypothetical protein
MEFTLLSISNGSTASTDFLSTLKTPSIEVYMGLCLH